MERAIELALKGEGRVNPNPLVGAVLVKDGTIISEGWHEYYGGFHAERNCILNCSQDTRGSVMYVTLEPCCHYGKTPPCTEIIMSSGIKKVVVGTMDPNPLMSGNGVRILREHGIEVVCGVLEQKCRNLNRVFFHFVKTGEPYVTLKYAMTMDGKTATRSKKSKWITGETARHAVHEERKRSSGIMVGIGTVLADDPLLTCRIENGKNPVRIICDTHLTLPMESRLVKTASDVPVIIATACSDKTRQMPYMQYGCQIVEVPEVFNTGSDSAGSLDLRALMKKLGKMDIDSILLEGGSTLAWSALNSGIVQRVITYIAPKIFGGVQAPGAVGGLGVDEPAEAFCLRPVAMGHVGEDFYIESEVEMNVHRNH